MCEEPSLGFSRNPIYPLGTQLSAASIRQPSLIASASETISSCSEHLQPWFATAVPAISRRALCCKHRVYVSRLYETVIFLRPEEVSSESFHPAQSSM